MKIHFKHLKKFFVNDIDISSLSNTLFQLGHENEVDRNILDIEFTPNRGDCLSLNGISRDLSAIYQTNFPYKIYKDDIDEFELDFENNDPLVLEKISFLYIEIENSQIKKYKDYLKNYFVDFDLKRNNFFTDISNYLAYETGLPTHCYDFNKINGKITFETINASNKFNTLFGNIIDLDGINSVFKINNEIINLAGVMGGLSTACEDQTKKVLIECARFQPEAIIGKTTKYGLNSDAAYKFERGVDKDAQEFVLRRFIQIIKEHTEVKEIKLFSRSYNNHEEIRIPYNLNKLSQIIGSDFDNDVIQTKLSNIGFNFDNESIIPPTFRSDIAHQNDIAEEILRILGYDTIPQKEILLPTDNDRKDLFERKLKAFLINYGFAEVINFPFTSLSDDNSIKIDNPLDSNKPYLRLNLKESLIEDTFYNEKRNKDSIKLFEISDIYKDKLNIKQERFLGIAISGRVGNNLNDFSKKLDKKYLIDIFRNLNIDVSNFIQEIDRNIYDTKIKTKLFLLEIPLNIIEEASSKLQDFDLYMKNNYKYEEISEFPIIYRDLSYRVLKDNDIGAFSKKIMEFKTENLRDVFIFDYYKDNKNITKMAYRFIFQSFNKTLTDREVNKEIKEIIDNTLIDGSIEIPGLDKLNLDEL